MERAFFLAACSEESAAVFQNEPCSFLSLPWETYSEEQPLIMNLYLKEPSLVNIKIS